MNSLRGNVGHTNMLLTARLAAAGAGPRLWRDPHPARGEQTCSWSKGWVGGPRQVAGRSRLRSVGRCCGEARCRAREGLGLGSGYAALRGVRADGEG
jgi:hypothetical protein